MLVDLIQEYAKRNGRSDIKVRLNIETELDSRKLKFIFNVIDIEGSLYYKESTMEMYTMGHSNRYSMQDAFEERIARELILKGLFGDNPSEVVKLF